MSSIVIFFRSYIYFTTIHYTMYIYFFISTYELIRICSRFFESLLLCFDQWKHNICQELIDHMETEGSMRISLVWLVQREVFIGRMVINVLFHELNSQKHDCSSIMSLWWCNCLVWMWDHSLTQTKNYNNILRILCN